MLNSRTISNELRKQKEFKDLVKSIRDSYEHYDEKLLQEHPFVGESSYRIDNAMDFGDEKFHFDDSSLVLPSKLYGIIIQVVEEHVKDRKEKVDGYWERYRAMQKRSLELDMDE